MQNKLTTYLVGLFLSRSAKEDNGTSSAVKDSQIKSSREECALSMGQRPNDAALKDAQINFKRDECAKSMEQ